MIPKKSRINLHMWDFFCTFAPKLRSKLPSSQWTYCRHPTALLGHNEKNSTTHRVFINILRSAKGVITG